MMKVKPVKLGKTERMSFSHIDEVISMPNLIEVQKNSYQWFLDEGLKEVFHDIGTIEDYSGLLDQRCRFSCYLRSGAPHCSSLFRSLHHRFVCQCLCDERDEYF